MEQLTENLKVWNEWGRPPEVLDAIISAQDEQDKVDGEMFEKTMRKRSPMWRLTRLEEELTGLRKQYENECHRYEKMIRQDLPYWFRSLSGDRLGLYVREIKRLETTIYFLTHHDKRKNVLTGEEIARAKECPFDKFLTVEREYALCPFHADKRPSFWVKNNYGYCFGCNWKGDQIKFLMDRDRLSFPEAVRFLNNF